jgi:hypothetical protein
MVFIAVLALAAAIFYKKHSETTVPVIAVAVPATNPPAPAPVAVVPSPSIQKTLAPEEREQQIQRETERLAVLAMNSDAESLSNILADLTSPEKEIRMAAIEAAKQFDSTNAIPVLKAMAEQATDLEEANALAEAVEFLELPDANLGGGNGGSAAKTSSSPAATNQDLVPPQ